MAIKVVFFDMGETLCHQDPSTPEIVGDFLKARRIAVSSTELRRAYLAGMTYYSEWALAVDVADRTEERRDAMIGGFYSAMVSSLGVDGGEGLIAALREDVLQAGSRRFAALFPDVLPTLRQLRDYGLRMGVISNWDPTLTTTVHELGLTEYLEDVVSSGTVGVEKPNPSIFRFALDRMGVGAGEAVHVGDIYYMDVLGARSAGLTPVLVDRYALQDNVDCLRVESLAELPRVLQEVIK